LKLTGKKSLADPYLRVIEKKGPLEKDWKVYAETEYLDDAPNAEWPKVFWFNWNKGRQEV